MYPTRQPITNDGINAHRAADRGRAALPYASSIARDVEGELAELYRENPGISRDEVLMTGRFSEAQLEKWGKSAATRAARGVHRRAA